MNSTKVLKLQNCYRFQTSGTTGTARHVLHPHEFIHREIKYLAALLESRRRVVSLVPQHHIYGYLWTVLVPNTLHIEARAWPVALQPNDLLVGFPGAFRRVPSDQSLFGVWAVNSGAASGQEEFARLRDQGCDRWIDVYGSTETAGIGLRGTPDEPFTLFPWWPDQFPDAPDDLAWVDARRFIVLGRKDGAVQVSGVNVYPERVAEVLAQCPGVMRAYVRKMRPEEGPRLKAFIVGNTTGTTLDAWCEAHLSSVERPARFSFGEQLPTGDLGKPVDW
jgi:4-coumarate--CoA ligase (photoactive yellow protein activation family)